MFIASGVILLIFITGLFLSLRQAKKNSSSLKFNQQKAIQQTQDDQRSAQAIKKIHNQFPWYSKIPVETADYRIIYDFAKESFRIRLLTQDTDKIRQAALDSLGKIGVDLNEFQYYFIEPKPSP